MVPGLGGGLRLHLGLGLRSSPLVWLARRLGLGWEQQGRLRWRLDVECVMLLLRRLDGGRTVPGRGGRCRRLGEIRRGGRVTLRRVCMQHGCVRGME